jgi:predicted GIY-YIG superfamily endonuclease
MERYTTEKGQLALSHQEELESTRAAQQQQIRALSEQFKNVLAEEMAVFADEESTRIGEDLYEDVVGRPAPRPRI